MVNEVMNEKRCEFLRAFASDSDAAENRHAAGLKEEVTERGRK